MKLTKKVLIIAYQFPPMGGSGVHRTVKFVKYLPRFNWQPIVLTRKVKNMALKDTTLLSEINNDIKIYRTNPFDLTELAGILKYPGKFIGRKILIPDNEVIWQTASRKNARNILANEKPDLIYTTSYPYSDHLIGLHLKTCNPHLPWVADFRDEWTNNPYLKDNPYSSFRMKREIMMEKKVLSYADRLITNTPVMMENFLRLDPSFEKKFHVIPNGYDSSDFYNIGDLIKPDASKFILTYTGAFYGRRKPDTLFNALSKILKEGTASRQDIEVKLIGNFKTVALQKTIDSFGLRGIVNIYPYMPHKECLVQLVNSTAVVLIEGNGPGAEAFYTGKVFEYMNTGRPILGIIPVNGAAANLIRETSTGNVADFSDIDAIAKNILLLYNEWKNGINSYRPCREKINKFERKNLAAELSEIFNSALLQYRTGG